VSALNIVGYPLAASINAPITRRPTVSFHQRVQNILEQRLQERKSEKVFNDVTSVLVIIINRPQANLLLSSPDGLSKMKKTDGTKANGTARLP